VDAESARQRPLFAVESHKYRWDDVVRLARLRGDWDVLARDVRAGLAALRELELQGLVPDAGEIDAARHEFRYARGLLSGDDLADWLDRRGVTLSDWQAYLERRIARDSVPETAAVPEVAQGEVDSHLWAEAVFSGRLGELAETLARLIAIAPDKPLEALEESFELFCRSAISDAAVAHEIEVHRLEWIRLEYETVAFDDEDSALEAALCVRSDGQSLPTVAGRAGETLERRVDWLEGTEPELASKLLAARPGDLVGPLTAEGRPQLALLRQKIPPSPDDDAVRARAADAVVERAVERVENERVVWLEAL